MKKINLILILILILSSTGFAQVDTTQQNDVKVIDTIPKIDTEKNNVSKDVELKNNETKNNKETSGFQISFIYPLGSHGVTSNKYNNKVSLNALIGVNGGVGALEMGGIANINSGNISGAQFGGIFNIGTKTNVNGFQAGGIVNFNNGSVKGIQMGGIFNINTKECSGVQMGGIANINGKYFKGIQLNGIFNINNGNVTGLQMSGIINVNNGYSKGANIAGIANISKDSVRGVQIGLINVTKKLKGVQIGLINVVEDAEEGLPIGLINIVKKGGYRELEIMGGDAVYLNVNFKLGVEKLYTVFKTGLTYYENEVIYSSGLGFGTIFNLGEKLSLSADLSANRLRPLNEDTFDDITDDNDFDDTDSWDDFLDEWDAWDINLLTKLDLNLKYKFGKRWAITVGPSINMYFTELYSNNKWGNIYVPYKLWNDNRGGTEMSLWVGLNAGLSIRL